MGNKHQRKNSWPGNFCLKCGAPDPIESTRLIDCPHCDSGCEECCYTGCVLGPAVEFDGSCPVEP